MKAAILVLGFLISIQSFGQEGHFYFDGDTLVLTNSEFVIDPFQFGEGPLIFLKKQSPSSIDTALVENLHVNNQIDTLFTFNVGRDLFQVYKNPSDFLLVRAIVYSKKHAVQKGIRSGMRKNGFAKNFKLDFKEELPDYFRIRDLEFMTWIDFTFKKGRLSKISFIASMD